jgi:hypothetical protein
MSNSNSQLDGLGSFNQSAKNAGTIKYGAFLNASQNLGTIALSATFGNTSQNLGTIGDIIPIITASIVQSNSANWDAAYTAVVSNSAVWILSGGSGSGDATNAPIWDAVAAYVQAASSTFLTLQDGSVIKWDEVSSFVQSNSAAWMSSDTTNSPAWDAASSYVIANSASLVFTSDSRLTDERTPLSHTHSISSVDELQSSLDSKASISSIANKADLSAFEVLNTLVQDNSGTWEDVEVVYNYVRSNSASTVYTDDVRLAKADTSYTYVNSNSANIVMTSDSRLTSGTTAYTYVNSNSADIVMTSDSRLANGNVAYSSVTANSASWSMGISGSINYTIDGGGNAITTGSKGFIQIPTNFVVQEWIIFADLLTTSLIIDVRKASYANLPTTTTIVNSNLLTLTNQQKNRNTSVSWTNISAGDFVEFFVTDASNASIVNISLKGIRS